MPQGFRYDDAGKPIKPSRYDDAGNPVYDDPTNALDTALDVGRGVLKGAAHTLGTLRNAARDYIPGVAALDPNLPYGGDPGLTNTAQKVGFGAEQIGEFMLPGGIPRKAAVAIAAKAGPMVANAPRIVRGAAELLPRMATEAATAAGITAAQGGDPTTAAGVSAAIPAVGSALKSVVPATKRLAARQVERFMQPGTKMTKYEARQIAPEILERKILGTPESVERLAEAKRKEVGAMVGAAEKRLAALKPGDVVDLRNLRSALVRQARSYTTTGLGGQQLTVAGRQIYHHAAKEFLDMIDQLPQKVPVKQAADLKRQWQDVVRVARGYLEDAPQQAQARMAKEAAKAVRKALLRINTVDELKGLYDEFGFWAKLENVLGDTALRRTGQQGWGKKVIATLAMSGMGGAGAGAPGAAAMGALTLAIQTPTWKLTSAQIKNQLADALVSGNYKQVKFLTDRIIKGTVSLATRQPEAAK